MIQCTECEHYKVGPHGKAMMTCDPFTNIKEPECLTKWQLVQLNVMVEHQDRLQRMYDRLAPMQEKLFRHVEQEIEDQNEADAWKYQYDEDEEEDDDNEWHSS